MQMKKVAMIGMVFVIAACGGGAQLISGPDLLTYTASSQVTTNNPMKFSTTVTVTNNTNESISFTPSCPIPRTFVFANASRTGTPIWDSNTRAPTPCAASLTVTLAPGKSVNYTLTGTGAEVLGASGAAGTYYLEDEVTLDGVSTRITAGSLALAR
jgi:hypothetical protein